MDIILTPKNQEGLQILKKYGIQWRIAKTNLQNNMHLVRPADHMEDYEMWIALEGDPRVSIVHAVFST